MNIFQGRNETSRLNIEEEEENMRNNCEILRNFFAQFSAKNEETKSKNRELQAQNKEIGRKNRELEAKNEEIEKKYRKLLMMVC